MRRDEIVYGWTSSYMFPYSCSRGSSVIPRNTRLPVNFSCIIRLPCSRWSSCYNRREKEERIRAHIHFISHNLKMKLTSHSIGQCFCSGIDIIILATWTDHCIDDIRCLACLKRSHAYFYPFNTSKDRFKKTYGWTIEICCISIEKLMHGTGIEINNEPRLTFLRMIDWMTTCAWLTITWKQTISWLRCIFSTEKTFIVVKLRWISSTVWTSFHVEYIYYRILTMPIMYCVDRCQRYLLSICK